MNPARIGLGARRLAAAFLFGILAPAWASPPVGIITGPVAIGGNAPVGGFSLADVVMVNGQRVVYFNAADAQRNIQIDGAPPPQVAFAPVPVNAPLALCLAALAVMGAAFLGLRMRHRNSGTGA
jgi:hypothetical protein